jgi:RNA polymerase-binding transcription factor DksA
MNPSPIPAAPKAPQQANNHTTTSTSAHRHATRPAITGRHGTMVATVAATLSPDQLVALRGMLEQQGRFRRDQIEQLHRADNLGRLSATDPQISDSLVTGARAALRDVRNALARMDDGSYGTCQACGVRLPIERLEILPQVALCMPCQRSAESF